MRIAVWGVGAMGGYYGGLLARAGHEVVFVARGAQLAALRRDGLRVDSVDGDFHLPRVQVTDEVGAIGAVDHVIVCVKTWQVAEGARAIGPLLGDDTAVMTVQNGVEAPGVVAEVVGQDRVLPGIAKVFAELVEPGRIRHGGGPGSLTFAEWDGRTSERVAELRSALAAAGVAIEEPADIWAALWSKFLFVVPLGGLGAVTGEPVGVVRSKPETRQLLEAGMTEIQDVAAARGVALPHDVVSTLLAFVDAQPAEGRSSLQRDIAAGRPSELEAWNGAASRLGREVGVDTPVNTSIYERLLPLERRARGIS